MRDSIFFDTNVLVYGFDETDHRKYEIASQLITKAYEEGNGVISTQVLQEFHVTVTQKIPKKLDLDVAEQTVRDLSLWRVVETSVSLILNGIKLQRRYQLSLWDAMIVASAKVSNCETLLTEDLSHGAVLEGVRVFNPFFQDPRGEKAIPG